MAEKLPLTANVRWFQLGFGAFAGVVLYQLAMHGLGRAPLSQGGIVGRILALALGLLIFAVYLQNVYRFGLVPDYSKKCRFCNGPVNRYSEFCEHCGADLIAEDKLLPCPKCGVDVYEGTKFCPECGALVAKPAKDKGKKGHKKRREEAEAQGTASVGWSTPIDATTGFPPPEDERERR
ncbi:MAG TPA: zinc ribbon domain-containing protein [Candidatus Thermoplasmatota archaeon]|nr:zinc ribbon domain-containing protein [Candidatus Thermoplasmatota archaeon]